MHLFKCLTIILALITHVFITSPSAAEDEPKRSAMQAVLDDELTYKLAVGGLEDVKILIERGASPNATNEQGIPALAIAVEREPRLAYPLVKFLIEQGADVNTPLPDESTVLMLAIEREEVQSVWHLLKEGAEFRRAGPHGMTPLQLAQRSENAQILSLLQKAHAITQNRYDAERSKQNRDKMLYRFAYYSCSLQYLNYLVSSGMMDPADHPALSADAINKRASQLDRYRREMVRLFPIDPTQLAIIRDRSMQAIVDDLDKLVSNRLRRMKKVGTQADLKKRCTKVSSNWKEVQPGEEE